jgi:hypothetical protein
MMTIETLKQNIEKTLGYYKDHALSVTNSDKMRITLPGNSRVSDYIYGMFYLYPWCAIGYEVMNFIWGNKIELKWERRRSPGTIMACDSVGSIDGRDIICSKHQGFDVSNYFFAESSVVIDDLAELLLQHVKPTG